jgi:hypothetical protein
VRLPRTNTAPDAAGSAPLNPPEGLSPLMRRVSFGLVPYSPTLPVTSKRVTPASTGSAEAQAGCVTALLERARSRRG